MTVQEIFAENDVVIQEGDYTCGPVAILNALHLKGDFSHNEEELAVLCDAKPGIGTTNEAIVKVAEQVGLEVIEEKSNAALEDIERNIDQGAYVIVCYLNAFSGNGHYTVITGYDDRAFYCVDSSYGLPRFYKPFFDKYWYGSDKSSVRWYAAVR